MRCLLTSIFCLFLSLSYAQSEFITTWKTDNPGVSEDNQITIPSYFGNITQFNVAWGDGTETTFTSSANITHTYSVPGTYIVEITGDFIGLNFNNDGDKEKIISVDQWGAIPWASTQTAFRGCTNLNVIATDSPDLSQVSSMNQMFFECSSLIGNASFNNWDTSNVSSMDSLFAYCTLFNQPIGNWNVENVINLGGTFLGCSSFNQYIGDWDVQNVESMVFTFGEATAFNQNIGNWNVSNVVSMFWTFINASSFNQDISNWNISSVTDLSGMFMGATSFNQPIGLWDIRNVTRVSNLFSNAQNFNQPLENWNLTNVTDTSNMFYYAYAFNQDISNWDVSTVTKMNGMFNGATTFNQSISNWNVSSAIDMSRMFQYAYSFNQNLENWDVGQVTDMSSMFEGANSFNQNIGGWDVGNVVNMFRTFTSATLFNQPIGNWNVSNVTNMEMMFWNTINFNQPLENWNVSNVTNMKELFSGSSIFNQELNSWDVSNVTNMLGMFTGCSAFNKSLFSWNTTSVNNMTGMFFEADSFNQPIGEWDISNVTNLRAMFFGADLFNQSIGNWNVSNVTDMSSMFERATGFSQNLGNWNISQVNTLANMFNDAGISQENYDETLIGWANLPFIQDNVLFDAGVSTYCFGESAKLKLINEYGWEISDGGKANCPFITTWKTDNPGLSEDNQINIPTFPGETYDYTVDWGDGIIESNFIGDATHTYANSGTYQVSISGVFPRIYFNNYLDAITDAQKILTVNQWGEIEWKSMENSFLGCKNLDVIATDMPDLSNVTSLASMFAVCTSLQGNVSMNSWNLSNVNSINGMFGSAENFNIYVGDWNVTSVTDMGGMFFDALSFNQDIGNWNVANVTNMSSLFYGATNFNQNIGEWDISNVTNMNNMFDHAISFNQDIGNWDVSNVTEMSSMFTNADAFNGDISGWDVSKVQYMDGMFYGAARFNQNIGNWNVSNVIGMQAMLGYTEAFNQDISGWNVGNVITMNSLFNGAGSFDQDIGEWNVSNVENMQAIFYGATQFDQDLSKWDVSNVTNMLFMLNDSGVSVVNYDLLLNSWSQQSLQNNVQFEASNIQYCDGENARQYLTDTYGWIITDGGKVPFCNEDNDLDGILDHLDTCLETSPNVIVNDNGCEIIAADAILVYGATPTCPGEANGSISISSALTDYNFNIAIEGPISSDYNGISLNENLEIPNLITGLYTVTVSIPDISYSQTYGIQINEVGTISGKRDSLNTTVKTASYNVEGSYTYTVDVNGELKTFNFMTSGINEIQLTDLAEFNAISITGESDCQGVVTDSFAFSEGVIMYPTITTGEVFVEGFDESSTVLVYDLAGRLVLSQILSGKGSNSIDLRALENGMYPTVIQSKENSKAFKIIKQ